jgi:hypothetical protein
MATASVILWLRRIASCFFLTLAILFAALWVRSYFRVDHIYCDPGNTDIVVESGLGMLPIMVNTRRAIHPPRLDWSVRPVREFRISPGANRLGFKWMYSLSGETAYFQIPYWFPTLTSVLLAIVIRPAPRFKFSLRDLLTLMTVAALTVGPLAFWLRSIG